MIRRRRPFLLILVLALCARLLPLCDPAFAMPAMGDVASACEMMGKPSHTSPVKSHVKPLCLTGCPIIALRGANCGEQQLAYPARYEFVLVEILDGVRHPPATPPPRLD